MVRQQALTILGSAAASAAATAALLFLWNPAEPAPSADFDAIASLRREVAQLRGELAARPDPLPPPMVAERVVDADAGRARDELQRRCDDLAARCEELERTVSELHDSVANLASRPLNNLAFSPTYGEASRANRVQVYYRLGDGKFTAPDLFFPDVSQLNATVSTDGIAAIPAPADR